MKATNKAQGLSGPSCELCRRNPARVFLHVDKFGVIMRECWACSACHKTVRAMIAQHEKAIYKRYYGFVKLMAGVK